MFVDASREIFDCKCPLNAVFDAVGALYTENADFLPFLPHFSGNDLGMCENIPLPSHRPKAFQRKRHLSSLCTTLPEEKGPVGPLPLFSLWLRFCCRPLLRSSLCFWRRCWLWSWLRSNFFLFSNSLQVKDRDRV